MTHIVAVTVPLEPDHTPLSLVEYGGYQWLVREVDTVNGVALLERSLPEVDVRRTEYVVRSDCGWLVALGGWLVALVAVFLFLALLVQIGHRLTFSDVVGCIIGFVILVLLLDRRERERDGRR